MGTFSIWHWLVVLVIVVLVFGTKKLRNLGGDLGSAIKGFKDGMKEPETGNTAPHDPIIEVEARKDTSTGAFKENSQDAHRTPTGFSAPPTQMNKPATENSTTQSINVNNQSTDAQVKKNTN